MTRSRPSRPRPAPAGARIAARRGATGAGRSADIGEDPGHHVDHRGELLGKRVVEPSLVGRHTVATGAPGGHGSSSVPTARASRRADAMTMATAPEPVHRSTARPLSGSRRAAARPAVPTASAGRRRPGRWRRRDRRSPRSRPPRPGARRSGGAPACDAGRRRRPPTRSSSSASSVAATQPAPSRAPTIPALSGAVSPRDRARSSDRPHVSRRGIPRAAGPAPRPVDPGRPRAAGSLTSDTFGPPLHHGKRHGAERRWPRSGGGGGDRRTLSSDGIRHDAPGRDLGSDGPGRPGHRPTGAAGGRPSPDCPPVRERCHRCHAATKRPVPRSPGPGNCSNSSTRRSTAPRTGCSSRRHPYSARSSPVRGATSRRSSSTRTSGGASTRPSPRRCVGPFARAPLRHRKGRQGGHLHAQPSRVDRLLRRHPLRRCGLGLTERLVDRERAGLRHRRLRPVAAHRRPRADRAGAPTGPRPRRPHDRRARRPARARPHRRAPLPRDRQPGRRHAGRRGRARGRRHHPLHLGDHRVPQGCRLDPPRRRPRR